MGRFQKAALAEHHLGANGTNKLGKLWKLSGLCGTLQQQPGNLKTSTKGTSGGTSIATRNHVALAAWSMERALWVRLECIIGEAERLNGAPRHVLHDKLAGRVRRKLGQNVGARQPHQCSDLLFICMEDWNMTSGDMEKTEKMGGVHLLRWQQTIGLRTCRPKTRERGHGGAVLGSRMEIARCKGNQHSQSTTHTMNIACMPRNVSSKEIWEQKWIGMKFGLCRWRRRRKPKKKRGQTWTKQARQVGALC